MVSWFATASAGSRQMAGNPSQIKMYKVYIIRSIKTGKYYIGYTANFEKRLKEHNIGKTKSTNNRGPYQLIYSEEYENKHEAYKRERQIKSYKGGNAFKVLINKQHCGIV